MPRDADAGELGGQHRLVPRGRDEALRGEVVDLVRLRRPQRRVERRRVEEVALDQVDAVDEMRDSLDVLSRGATRHPEHLVAFFEQELGQVRAVLPGDPGDQRPSTRHGAPPYMRVGISLLTLVPGVVGGSETYARELVRALGRVGELDYRVFKPTIAEDVCGRDDRARTGRARSMPGRHRRDEPARRSRPAGSARAAAAASWTRSTSR